MIKNSLKSTDPAAKVIVFGSYAGGDYHEEPDTDLLLLIDKGNITRDDEMKITYPLYDIEYETGILICPMVYPKDCWETKQKVTPFYENVNREGVEL